MAIDSTLFVADIPAGTYALGDTVQLKCVAGPEIVRSGRGAAKLKRLTTGIIGTASGSASYWKIQVKNSDWIDPMTSMAASLRAATALDERAGSVQRGNDCPLTPNSSWEVVAVCTAVGVTTTVANTIFALVDIDYPSVSAITDPDALPGIPTSINYQPSSINANALGTGETSLWDVFNIDIFKAGYLYALQKIELAGSVQTAGFIALANAAGMGGLQRIMPITYSMEAIRNKVEYSTKLVKGPMDIKFLLFANSATATTDQPDIILDFVKIRQP